jgi:oligopeptide/dipeptide ABC transporter ATP-binding protein
LYSEIGVIFQDFMRYEMTARENIAVGRIERMNDLELLQESARKSMAADVLRKLPSGLEQMLGRRFDGGVDLSGGEWQKVALARAYLRDAQVLILDEPTSALDVSVQAVILRLLADLRERLAMSYLFVSHDLNVVRMLSARVVVMYLGKVVEIAPAEALFTAPHHPYSRALVAAIPDPARRGEARPRLDGSPTSPIDPDPNACRFYGRCPMSTDLCASAMPQLRTVGLDHFAACHFALASTGGNP